MADKNKDPKKNPLGDAEGVVEELRRMISDLGKNPQPKEPDPPPPPEPEPLQPEPPQQPKKPEPIIHEEKPLKDEPELDPLATSGPMPEEETGDSDSDFWNGNVLGWPSEDEAPSDPNSPEDLIGAPKNEDKDMPFSDALPEMGPLTEEPAAPPPPPPSKSDVPGPVIDQPDDTAPWMPDLEQGPPIEEPPADPGNALPPSVETLEPSRPTPDFSSLDNLLADMPASPSVSEESSKDPGMFEETGEMSGLFEKPAAPPPSLPTETPAGPESDFEPPSIFNEPAAPSPEPPSGLSEFEPPAPGPTEMETSGFEESPLPPPPPPNPLEPPVPIPGTIERKLEAEPPAQPIREMPLERQDTAVPDGVVQVGCVFPEGEEARGQQFVSKLKEAGQKAKTPMNIEVVYIQPWQKSNLDMDAWEKAASLAGASYIFLLISKKEQGQFQGLIRGSKQGVWVGRVVFIEQVNLRTLYADVLIQLGRLK